MEHTARQPQKNDGVMFRVQRDCMFPKAVKDVSRVKVAIMQWKEQWEHDDGTRRRCT